MSQERFETLKIFLSLLIMIAASGLIRWVLETPIEMAEKPLSPLLFWVELFYGRPLFLFLVVASAIFLITGVWKL